MASSIAFDFAVLGVHMADHDIIKPQRAKHRVPVKLRGFQKPQERRGRFIYILIMNVRRRLRIDIQNVFPAVLHVHRRMKTHGQLIQEGQVLGIILPELPQPDREFLVRPNAGYGFFISRVQAIQALLQGIPIGKQGQTQGISLQIHQRSVFPHRDARMNKQCPRMNFPLGIGFLHGPVNLLKRRSCFQNVIDSCAAQKFPGLGKSGRFSHLHLQIHEYRRLFF